MSGVQALVRLPMLQRHADANGGLNTAGFVSGYRGQPARRLRQALWARRRHLAAQNIVFQPGSTKSSARRGLGHAAARLYPQKNKFDGVFASGTARGRGRSLLRCLQARQHGRHRRHGA